MIEENIISEKVEQVIEKKGKDFGKRDKYEKRGEKEKKEFDEVLLEVRRVTRVTTGGRRMSFRATVLVGNRKGKIGVGTEKGADVSIAVQKASHEAYKNMFTVPLTKFSTVPYPTTLKYKACTVRLMPASSGTGLKAGSSVRSVLELAGYKNVLSKIMGSNNKLNNALVTIQALSTFKHADHFSKLLETSDKEESGKKEIHISDLTKKDVDISNPLPKSIEKNDMKSGTVVKKIVKKGK